MLYIVLLGCLIISIVFFQLLECAHIAAYPNLSLYKYCLDFYFPEAKQC